jgi:hypothetical protein
MKLERWNLFSGSFLRYIHRMELNVEMGQMGQMGQMG